MEFCNFKKKLEEKETHKDNMIDNLKKLETYLNSELSIKIRNSLIENNELLIEVDQKDLVQVIQFLKSDDNCKFRQLIDIAGVDPQNNEDQILVECKAPSVKITQATFDQIARYNLNIQSRYLMVTNGLDHYFCKMDYDQQCYSFIKDLPKYLQK